MLSLDYEYDSTVQAKEPTTLGIGDGGWSGIGTVATTAFSIWSSISQAEQQQRMQEDLVNHNNTMRAIVQGVKQYTADRNRAAVGDANVDTQIQIELDKLRAQASTETQAAFMGASSSAKRAAMYDINRNAVVAKFNQQGKFENALRQIQLSEYSDNMQFQLASQPKPINNVNAIGQIGSGVMGLVDKSVKSGAWEKGGQLRTYFSSLFNNDEAQLPED